MALDLALRRELLALARTALESGVHGSRGPLAPRALNLPACGLFVTITCAGELRGCLGTLDPTEGLAEATARLAADVARRDDRFRPVAVHELGQITIDLSVLMPAEHVSDPATIEVGRHGLIIKRERRRGLLLPQVARAYGWDRETFLRHTCLKAGLSPDAWQHGATIMRFEAEVFGEQDHAGALQ